MKNLNGPPFCFAEKVRQSATPSFQIKGATNLIITAPLYLERVNGEKRISIPYLYTYVIFTLYLCRKLNQRGREILLLLGVSFFITQNVRSDSLILVHIYLQIMQGTYIQP